MHRFYRGVSSLLAAACNTSTLQQHPLVCADGVAIASDIRISFITRVVIVMMRGNQIRKDVEGASQSTTDGVSHVKTLKM